MAPHVALCGKVQSSAAVVSHQGDICSSVKYLLHQVHLPISGGPHQRRCVAGAPSSGRAQFPKLKVLIRPLTERYGLMMSVAPKSRSFTRCNRATPDTTRHRSPQDTVWAPVAAKQ